MRYPPAQISTREKSIEVSPKALPLVQMEEPNGRKKASAPDPEDFSLSKDMIILLKKHNLCIRPLIGKSSKRGSGVQKKRSREVTSLLRSWENEADERSQGDGVSSPVDVEWISSREIEVSQ